MKLSDAIKRVLQEGCFHMAEEMIENGEVSVETWPTADYELPEGRYYIHFKDIAYPMVISVARSKA